jgi:hypothetical protein
VGHLPEDVATLYDEARRAVAQSPNSAAYACRTILMHVAVEKGAETNKTFAYYVDYLQDHHLTPGTAARVDEIRQLGNDANHEIDLMTREEAETVVDFTAMLLQIVYEFPERGEQSARRRRDAGP